jgi:hypothetical protein
MAGRAGTYPGDYHERGAKHEATQEMLEDEEDFENMDDDDFVDQDVADDADFGCKLYSCS